jgi:uncharacterized protein (TIRG00374 family)
MWGSGSLEISSESQNLEQDAVAPVTWKNRVVLALKFALVGAVFYALHHKGLITTESFRKLAASPSTLLLCSLFMALNTLSGALRWQVLLRTHGADLGFLPTLKLSLIGMFFNIALPGAVSGDLVKGLHLTSRFKEKRAAIFGTIVLDRMLGVSAMVFIGAFSAALSLLVPWGGALPSVLLYSIGVAGSLAFLFFVYLFASAKRDPLHELLRWLCLRIPKLGAVERLYGSIMAYRAHPRRVIKAVLLSLAIHLLLILMAYFITEAISANALPVFPIAVIVPIGMLATTIPVLPAGVGTGHAAFYALFMMVGSNLGAEVFSMIVLYQVLVGAVGGLVYLKVLSERK